jgi:hypothetical protein
LFGDFEITRTPVQSYVSGREPWTFVVRVGTRFVLVALVDKPVLSWKSAARVYGHALRPDASAPYPYSPGRTEGSAARAKSISRSIS